MLAVPLSVQGRERHAESLGCDCSLAHLACYRSYQDLSYEDRSKMLKDRLKKYSQKVCLLLLIFLCTDTIDRTTTFGS